jgi:hypothetical protein
MPYGVDLEGKNKAIKIELNQITFDNDFLT